MSRPPPRPGARHPADFGQLQVGALAAKAERAFAAGDYPTTVRLAQELLRRRPDHPRALCLLGAMAQQTGSNDVATGFFTRALAADGRMAAAHMGLGDSHAAERRWREAIAAYGSAAALEPRNAEVHARMATALLSAGERSKAIEAFRRALMVDRTHKLAAYMLAELTGDSRRQQADYVRGVFDHYAPHFDAHLTGTLNYRMPQHIASRLAAEHPAPLGAVLDLGCGTGLVADALGEGRATAVDGVDISEKMLEVARRKGRYRRLHAEDLRTFLDRPDVAEAGYGLVIAADVFIYVGALEQIFPRVAAILQPGGLFAFSVEHMEGEGYAIQPSSRHAHSVSYVADLARRNSFDRLPAQLLPLREENRTPIMGRLEVLRRR